MLRKKPPGVLISKTAHAVEREYRIIRALGENSDVPVPEVYTLCEDVDVIGTPFYVMEFLKGRIFTDVRMLDLPFEERREWYVNLFIYIYQRKILLKYTKSWFSAVATLGKLHSVNFKSIGLEGYGKDNGFYARQMRSLGKVSDAQGAVVDEETGKAVGPIPRLDEMFAWFKRNEVKDQATIIHGDFKIDNMV